ncbi:MAG: carbohydrate-binding module family 14 protein [Alphaproteobacteria bacterium]|nr:carbohydrate-binding module family 14 protein [Alphaproteobacteria bacterium]
MNRFLTLTFILSVACFGTPMATMAALTCPTFDSSTGNTAISPNPLALTWVAGMVCNVPGNQVFTDSLGTYTFGTNCHLTCTGTQRLSDGVCITPVNPHANSCPQNIQPLDPETYGPVPATCPTAGVTVPTCPSGASDIFFTHPSTQHWYYECVNGTATCKQCATGRVWSHRHRQCVCGKTQNVCNSPFATHAEERCPGDGEQCEQCTAYECIRDSYLQEGKCHLFSEVGDGFTPPGENCDTQPGDNIGQLICPSNLENATMYVPHPTNSTWFYVCFMHVGSTPVAVCRQCPAGLVFNPSMNICDWA